MKTSLIESLYHDTSPAAAGFDAWQEPANVHTVIVGGGFAGINTALGLAERGISALVLEQNNVGFGASGRNGGFVFAGYSLGEHALFNALGANLAKAWYQRTQAAVNLIRQRINRYAITCDAVDAGVLWANWFDDSAVLSTRQSVLSEHFASDWRTVSKAELATMLNTTHYSGALFERNALHLNPLRLLRGLAEAARTQGARIVENVQVESVTSIANLTDGMSPANSSNNRRWRVITSHGIVECSHVVLACGGYLAGKLAQNQPALRNAVLPIATYVIATEPLGTRLKDVINTDAAVYDTRFAFDYYRATPERRIVWGGRINVRDAAPKQVTKMLRADMIRVYPQLKNVKIEYAWSGLMSYATHEMPQIGQAQPGLWHAQAFGGHGLAPCCVAGETLASAIATGDLSYLELKRFGLTRTFGALGLAAVQTKYWWLQGLDWWRSNQSDFNGKTSILNEILRKRFDKTKY